MREIASKEELQNEMQNSDKVIMLKFQADWCNPCKVMTKILPQLETEFLDKLDILEVDIDKNQDLCLDYGVRSVPTMIFVKNGSEVNRMVGVQSIKTLSDLMKTIG